MWYEILVVRHNKHFFATDKRSIDNRGDLLDVFAEIIKRFPPEDGFEVSAAEQYMGGKALDTGELMNDILKRKLHVKE